MALDRDATLKKAEKLLRQGRLEPAIAEYSKVVEEYPRDWNTANTLGDLYGRAGQTDKAIAQFKRIADHFMHEGFYPKAAALYKKIFKINPEDETVRLQLAEISARQGLLADAKSHFNAVAARRRERGDRRGEAEIVVRLGALDPADFAARALAARTLEEMGNAPEAAAQFRALYEDLLEKDRTAEAFEALKQVVRLAPGDRESRAVLAKAALEAGDFEGARAHLDRDVAGGDPALLTALAEVELRAGGFEEARALLVELLENDRELRHPFVELAWKLAPENADAAFVCIDVCSDAAIALGEFGEAAEMLHGLASRLPGQIPALLKLVEVCVDGGLETIMYDAQTQLTDAYLEAGQASEARVIAEDLVAREPWERAHIERFRRALVMLRVPEPDTVIAERLSGQSPFMATDPFVDLSTPDSPEAGAPGADTEASAQEAEQVGDRVADAADVHDDGAAHEGHEEIDLTGALLAGGARREEPAAKSASAPKLDDVFGAMREAAQEDAEQPGQHMTLARTYLEIGMVEEAIASLRTAARSPRQRFEAASMLGRLYSRQGDNQQALEWLERAAEAPAPSVAEGHALLYDLGVALEAAGETARALAVFLELQADAGDYKDVPGRIDSLARVQSGG